MTLKLPTSYRRNMARERNAQLLLEGSDANEDIRLQCLRCFRPATVGVRCDACRAARTQGNLGRKR